jgi:predicted dehydrogenase
MQGEAISTGEWNEIEVDDPVGEHTDLASNTSFMRGSVYLAEAVVQTLTTGEPWIKEAASFFDGLKIQQMLDAAQQSNQKRAWVHL